MKIIRVPFEKHPGASLEGYIQEPYSDRPRPVMIVVPGGSYLYKSKREKDPVVLLFASLGYQCFALNYSTLWNENYIRTGAPIVKNPRAPWPNQAHELLEAISYIRENKDRFFIDPDQIYITGFSAGGHIAASAGILWNDPKTLDVIRKSAAQVKPNGLVLCYPLLGSTMLKILLHAPEGTEWAKTAPYILESIFATTDVSEEMFASFDLIKRLQPTFPPCFIWHTSQDEVTSPEESTRFVMELLKMKIPCEYHLFDSGHHGMSLSTPAVAMIEGDYKLKNSIWPVLADLFLKEVQKAK